MYTHRAPADLWPLEIGSYSLWSSSNTATCRYWTFSAIFEERIAVDTQPEFCGQPHHATLVPKSRNNCAFGLMTPRGVRKAGWRGFELLHRHAGNQRLNVSIESSDNSSDIYAMATTNGTSTNSLRVFLSWWANPMYVQLLGSEHWCDLRGITMPNRSLCSSSVSHVHFLLLCASIPGQVQRNRERIIALFCL